MPHLYLGAHMENQPHYRSDSGIYPEQGTNTGGNGHRERSPQRHPGGCQEDGGAAGCRSDGAKQSQKQQGASGHRPGEPGGWYQQNHQ